ncbi:hypothetical protein CAPTEDRAFT_215085 [Capitella teleta]|uniref:Uncharacterized protein n=1 Tax=Capitella teleta TaxID=283909 RepID=R7TXH8_CAPTE|nr:hypothetical protein CAPTEDRAFT_215085 [Capitella teleta]|eukprot:ELT98633.1 hypothetical protein CAPTEDRAFT_215085 [Capitella teleta]
MLAVVHISMWFYKCTSIEMQTATFADTNRNDYDKEHCKKGSSHNKVKLHSPVIIVGGGSSSDSRRSRHTIKRSTKLVKADVTGEFGKVAIKAYKKPFVSALSCIKVSSLFPDELKPRSQKLSFALDQLWMASMILPVANLGAASPTWGGFMQLASKGENYERTRIEILPFINRQPTNPSSIYTALNFAREQSSLHGMETCFVTFDQPLYAKAIEIVASDEILQGVVVRLDGFHLLMSFRSSWLYHGRQWTRSSMGISLCPSISGAYDDRSCICPRPSSSSADLSGAFYFYDDRDGKQDKRKSFGFTQGHHWSETGGSRG